MYTIESTLMIPYPRDQNCSDFFKGLHRITHIWCLKPTVLSTSPFLTFTSVFLEKIMRRKKRQPADSTVNIDVTFNSTCTRAPPLGAAGLYLGSKLPNMSPHHPALCQLIIS